MDEHTSNVHWTDYMKRAQLYLTVIIYEKSQVYNTKYFTTLAYEFSIGRQAEQDGDADGGIGLIHSIPTCQELINDMIRETEETIRIRLANMVVLPKSRL